MMNSSLLQNRVYEVINVEVILSTNLRGDQHEALQIVYRE